METARPDDDAPRCRDRDRQDVRAPLDSNFISQPANPLYVQGDFNYDDAIDADDYFLIDSAFLGQGAPLATHTQATIVLATSAAEPWLLAESEQKSARERPVRTLFSERPVRIFDLPRRASGAARRA